jgi:hypothetical protein
MALAHNAEYSLDLTRYEVKARSAPEESLKTIDYTALARGLAANKSMDELILTKNKMTGDDLKVIAPALSGVSHLNILTLSVNPIGDDGVNALFDAVLDKKGAKSSLLTSLHTLDLGSTEITDAGLEKFFMALSEQSGPSPLVTLILTNNALTDATMDTLAKHLEKMPNLRSVAVSGNPGITDAGAAALAKAVGQFKAGALALRDVAVSGCAAGQAAIEDLRAALMGGAAAVQEQASEAREEARERVEEARDGAEAMVEDVREARDEHAAEARAAAEEAQEKFTEAVAAAREETSALREAAEAQADHARDQAQHQAQDAAAAGVAAAGDAAVDAIDAAIEAMAEASAKVAEAAQADAEARPE